MSIGVEASALPPLPVAPKPFPETEADHQATVRQLQRVLASPVFKNSQRNSKLLSYIVERTLEGRTDLLKERLLGADVFGRPPDYDTSSDHIVRSTAGEIRKRLAQFYLQPGCDAEIRIDLVPGSYVPQFRPVKTTTIENAARIEKLPDRDVSTPGLPPRRWSRTVVAATIALVAIAAALGTSRSPFTGSALQRFWSPLMESATPIALCTGDPRKAWSGSEASAFASFPFLGISSKRLVPPVATPNSWFYRNVPFGDAVTLSRITALISSKNKDYRVVYSPDSTLFDLRENSAVVVGGIDNFWTMNLTHDLRYRFQLNAQSNTIFIEDRQNSSRRDWQVKLDLMRNEVKADFAIVARVTHPITGRPVVVAGGIRDCGTLAAGEFLTSEFCLRELESHAPAQWTNVEAVISTKVFKGTPGRPQIVAAYFW